VGRGGEQRGESAAPSEPYHDTSDDLILQAYPSAVHLVVERPSLVDKRTETSATRKELNRQMRMAVKRFDLTESDGEIWAFLCECGDDHCQEWVTLPVEQYEALQRVDQPILYQGHTLSEPQKTRRKARRLVDDAKALEAQADVQVKRAKRNLEKKKPT
jgi:hypothetical protein